MRVGAMLLAVPAGVTLALALPSDAGPPPSGASRVAGVAAQPARAEAPPRLAAAGRPGARDPAPGTTAGPGSPRTAGAKSRRGRPPARPGARRRRGGAPAPSGGRRARATGAAPAAVPLLRRGDLALHDPRTLRPAGPWVDASSADHAAAAPGGRRVLLPSRGGKARVADLAGGRLGRRFHVGWRTPLQGLVWTPDDRAIAFSAVGPEPRLHIVDVRRRREVLRRDLALDPQSAVGTAAGAAAVLVPRGTIGSARVLLVGAAGGLREIALPGVSGGFAPEAPGRPGRALLPALVAGDAGRTVHVVGAAGDVVVSVDVTSGRTTSLALPRQARAAKLVTADEATAVMAGDGRIAVLTRRSRPDGRVDTARLRIVDLRAGTVEDVGPAHALAASAGRLLVDTGKEVRILDGSGRVRHRLLRGRLAHGVHAHGRFGYAYGHRRRHAVAWVVDLRSGRVLRRVEPAPVPLG